MKTGSYSGARARQDCLARKLSDFRNFAAFKGHIVSSGQKIVFLTGLLVAVSLAATLASMFLQRAFPEQPWVTIIGPLGAAGMMIALLAFFQRK
ncbi:hypothetical protein [Rhodopseudomonas palustris]|uniref:hypothetical protein n=1 Tax=Rhodopseudomonas palustris TaxID=1076 RepID=UPI0020CD3536|nr:hypothetical protein [Rhodopseudomonas palustris]